MDGGAGALCGNARPERCRAPIPLPLLEPPSGPRDAPGGSPMTVLPAPAATPSDAVGVATLAAVQASLDPEFFPFAREFDLSCGRRPHTAGLNRPPIPSPYPLEKLPTVDRYPPQRSCWVRNNSPSVSHGQSSVSQAAGDDPRAVAAPSPSAQKRPPVEVLAWQPGWD
jgi:hypothetical protein